MNPHLAKAFTALQLVNDNLSIASTAIAGILNDPALKARATHQDLSITTEILIDMTSLMASINHQALTLPQSFQSAFSNDNELALTQLTNLVEATENEYKQIRTKFASINHLLR